MSWLLDLFDCTEQCVLKCCESSELNKINSPIFWRKYEEKHKVVDEFKFLNEKNIYLNDECGSVLTIGINPKNRFGVMIRIEVKMTNSFIMMTPSNMNKLMEFINQHFDEQTVLPSTTTQNEDSDLIVKMSPIQQQIFKISVRDKHIKIDEDSLQSIYRARSHIKMYMLMLEYQRKPYELLFFKMLSHFCFEKSVKQSNELSDMDYIQIFFDEMVNFHCVCIDKSFVLEIATNFSQWFGSCVSVFIKTLMLNETARLQTYSTDWPHGDPFVNVKILAKTGLYFTGISDRVACVFCNLRLHEWNSTDNPVLDHFKYSPHCPLLQNPQITYNVPDDDGEKLTQLLLVLRNLKDLNGIDVV